jgi:tetratricopeptide (TPR) repeat protein
MRRTRVFCCCLGSAVLAPTKTFLALGITLLTYAQPGSDIGHLIASELHAGNYEKAKDLSQEALKHSPRDARLWTLDGIALVHLHDDPGALIAFQRALKLDPSYLPALEAAAELEYKAGNDGAAALLRQILKLRPDDRTAHAMLAGIAFTHGNCDEARDEFAKSQATVPNDVAPLQEFGSCLVKQKRNADALPVFAALSERQPGNSKGLYNLAVVEFLTGRYADVINTLTSAASGETLDADALDLLAEAYESVSDEGNARKALERAIAISPDVPRYYLDLAYICLEQRQFERGLEIVNAGLKDVPNAASLYVARGLLLCELAQYEKGLTDFATAERLDPNVELSSEARGLTELQRNNLPEAEKTVRDRIRAHPDNAFLYYLLGETLRKKGATPGSAEFKEAVRVVRKSVELDPRSNLSRDLLAALCLQSGETAEALEQSRIAYRANPADEAALYHLILALRKSNKAEEASALAVQLARLKKWNSHEIKDVLVDQSKLSREHE